MNRFALGAIAAGLVACVGQAGLMPTPWSYRVKVESDRWRGESGSYEGGGPYVPARAMHNQAMSADFTTAGGWAIGGPTLRGDRAVILATAKLVGVMDIDDPYSLYGQFNSYTSGGYTVTMRVTDGVSGQFDDFAFRGLLEGGIAVSPNGPTASSVTNTIVGPRSHDFRIGGKVYAVDGLEFTPFGEPELHVNGPKLVTRPGGLPAELRANVRIAETPEPATAVLAGLGLGLAALCRGLVRHRRFLPANRKR